MHQPMNQHNEFDTIIIGSGAGGLAAAICLSRAGQRVLVLEQHDVPGGWCHSFYLHGHRFTPGVHYIGLLDKGESTSELYEGLGIANDMVFFKMNPAAYEHCWIGEERIHLPSNFDDLVSSLAERFPHEKKNLTKYLNTVRQVSRELQLIPKMSGFWDNITIPWRTKNMGRYGLFTLKRVIDWHIKDPLLKRILNVQCGDHGLPPDRASFVLHSAVMDHYFSGGFYPMGGGGAMVKAMTNAIKGHKGEIRTSQGVNKILLDNSRKKKQAIGVELGNGEKIFSANVISNADPHKTYVDLVGRENLSKKLLKKLDKTKYSCTSLMLFLTVDMDVKKAGIDSGNIWAYPNADMDVFFNEMMAADILVGDDFPGFFVSCTTLKDPSSFDGKHHCFEVITYIHHKSFDLFKNEERERSPEYLDYKEKLTEKMLNSAERVIPGIRNHIVHKDLGTPLTNEYYINATEGSVYGTEKSLKHIGPFAFQSKSEIDNLFLCGASTMSHGVAGAGHSGVQTAANILKCKPEELLIKDDSQSVTILEAEDSSDYPEWLLQKIKAKNDRIKKQ